MNKPSANFVETFDKVDIESCSISDEYIGDHGIGKRELRLIYYI